MVFAQSCPAIQAHIRSHSGPGSSAVLHGAPTTLEFTVEPHLFRTLVLERLRLPLDVTEARCECGIPLDVFGRHRAACPRSGRLRTRAVGPERTLARICREAGATVRMNTKLRDMNVAVEANDERAIEARSSLSTSLYGECIDRNGSAHTWGQLTLMVSCCREPEPTKRGNTPNCSTARAVSS